MIIYPVIVVILYFSNFVVASVIDTDNYKLEQLQIVFRHGDRTPEGTGIFANDPYDKIYQTYGYGQLTKTGKQRMYKIGQFLRKRYDAFLGEYKSDEIYAYSSNSDRTKMSLQLVLAGLYPPSPSNSWSDSINWQPVPTHYEDFDISFLSMYECPVQVRAKLIMDIQKEPEFSELYQKYKSLYQRIENNTGISLPVLGTVVTVYNTLHSALSLGLELPSWCSKEDFDEIEKIVTLAFSKILTHTDQLRRAISGPLVEQIFNVLHTNDISKKIYLYSGHDNNISTFIRAHNITGVPVIQNYGNMIIMEKLRGPDDRHYIRLYLRTGVTEELFSLKLHNCDEICPLSEYEKIVQPILPNEVDRMCNFTKKSSCS